jgi:[ribosomal protein S5]-alanine N-acetyltransferase
MTEPPHIQLRAGSVELMEAAIAGEEELAAALGHPVAPGWVSFTEALAPTRDALAADPSRAEWGVRFFLAGEPPVLVGWGGFKGAPTNGVVELGYEIAPSRQRQGLASGAVAAMLAEAFATEAVMVVTAHTLPEKNPSNRLLENAGFAHEGVADDGEEIVWRYGLTRADWELRDAS